MKKWKEIWLLQEKYTKEEVMKIVYETWKASREYRKLNVYSKLI